MALSARVAAASSLAALAAGCGGDIDDPTRTSPARATVVELAGAEPRIDFDDLAYSPRLRRLLVPARTSGLYLVEPSTGEGRRYEAVGSADSADEGAALLFVVDREASTVTAVDPTTGSIVASAAVRSPPDYVRYVAATREVWITEPEEPGIEILSLGSRDSGVLRHAGFVKLADGAEGITVDPTGDVYTHSGNGLAVIDARTRSVTRLATGCDGTHGFPRVDTRARLALASCARDGTVHLLDLDSGRLVGSYSAGGGEALPAYSDRTRHFYARGDPGTTLATLSATRRSVKLVRSDEIPEVGHCLAADGAGHVWTCDAERGRLLRYDDA